MEVKDVTLEECLEFAAMGMYAIINDGKVIGFEERED